MNSVQRRGRSKEFDTPKKHNALFSEKDLSKYRRLFCMQYRTASFLKILFVVLTAIIVWFFGTFYLSFDAVIEFVDPNVQNKIMVVQAGYSNYLRLPQGMFADFEHILGAIIYGLKRGSAGIQVDFSNSAFYYDERYGNDWFGYYFYSFIKFKSVQNAAQITMDKWMAYHGQLKSFTHYTDIGADFPIGHHINHLDYLHNLTMTYLHVQPKLLDEIRMFKEENIQNNEKLIGVHFRGSDKLMNTPMKTDDKMAIFDAFKQAIINEIGQNENYKIFIATDEHLFKAFMSDNFGKDRVFWQKNSIEYSAMKDDAGKEYESVGLHKSDKYSGYEKSYSAMFDMLMLAESDCLIRSRSSLSDTSIVFAGTKLYYNTTFIDKDLKLLKNEK